MFKISDVIKSWNTSSVDFVLEDFFVNPGLFDIMLIEFHFPCCIGTKDHSVPSLPFIVLFTHVHLVPPMGDRYSDCLNFNNRWKNTKQLTFYKSL